MPYNDDNKIVDVVPIEPTVISVGSVNQLISATIDANTVVYNYTSKKLYMPLKDVSVDVIGDIDKLVADGWIQLAGTFPDAPTIAKAKKPRKANKKTNKKDA